MSNDEVWITHKILYCRFYTGPEDLFRVKSALEPVILKWNNIGLAVGLTPDQLHMIEMNHQGNCEDCITEALTLWLMKMNYNTEIFGEPSWEMLARAVGHPAGGNNPALAQEIARRYFATSVLVEN